MFTPDQVQQLRYGYLTVGETYFKLMSVCLSFRSQNAKSGEYILHGFLRRLGTLQGC